MIRHRLWLPFSSISYNHLRYLLIGIIIASGLGLRLFPLFHYAEFYYDQARDAFVVQQTLAGQWPSLGPSASVSSFSLPPQYYYLISPWALFSSWPQWQVLTNTIACLLGLIAVYFLVYCLLDKLPQRPRQIISLLSTLFTSLAYVYYGQSIGEWNPNPLPAVMALLGLSLYAIVKSISPRLYGRTIPSLGWWIIVGVCLGLATGLHATALFVLPLWLGLFSLYWFITTKQWKPQLVMLTVAAVCHLPYIAGQMTSGWHNSRQIVDYLLHQSGHISLLDRLDRVVDYNLMVGQAQLWPGLPDSSVVLVATVIVALVGGLAWYRLNRTLLLIVTIPWLIFCLTASGYQGHTPGHYLLIGFWLPLLCLAALAGYAYHHRRTSLLIIVAAIAAIGLSLDTYQVARAIKQDLYANHRLTVTDKLALINQLPAQATICSYYGQDHTDLRYIYRYLSHRSDLAFSDQSCQTGQVTIYLLDLPKRPALQPYQADLNLLGDFDKYKIQQIP